MLINANGERSTIELALYILYFMMLFIHETIFYLSGHIFYFEGRVCVYELTLLEKISFDSNYNIIHALLHAPNMNPE